MRAGCLVVLALAGCGDNLARDLPYYEWTGGGTVGAMELDHLAADDVGMLDQVDCAADSGWVPMFYTHVPGQDVDLATLDALLARAEAHGLAFFTYADLLAGPRRPGISLSFDDTEVDQWMLLRPILAKHGAHVSFFVTRYFEFSDAQRAELHQLYADGNTIEAHGVNHAYAVGYVADHGLDDFIMNEVVPSIDVLRADGFTPIAYAHPGGSHDREIDAAIHEHISLVRSISGAPKPCTRQN
jgi:hypothetical protein